MFIHFLVLVEKSFVFILFLRYFFTHLKLLYFEKRKEYYIKKKTRALSYLVEEK